MATRIQEGGGGMGSSGSKVFKKTPTVLTKAKIAKADAKKAEAKAALKAAKSKPPLATPKSNVKVTKRPGTMAENNMLNQTRSMRVEGAASGRTASSGAAKMEAANAAFKAAGKKTKVIKIK